MKNVTALKTVMKPPAPLTVDETRAEREAAEDAFKAAQTAVQAQVDRWPAPNNDRRWISQMYTAPRLVNDYTLAPQNRDALDRLAEFRRAVEGETEAENKLNDAMKAEAEAIRLAFGDGRGALADAIVAARDRVTEANAVRAAAERARGALVKAQMINDAAGAALADAREAAIDAATADGAGPANLKDLRRAAADAADDLDIATEAARRAEAAVVDPEYDEQRAREAIGVAARAVLYAEFDTRIAALAAMVTKFKSDALTHAAWLRAAVPNDGAWTAEKAQDLQRADSYLRGLTALGEPINETPYQRGDNLFASSLAALMQDAAAPLPEVP